MYLHIEQKDEDGYYRLSDQLSEGIMNGVFPENIREQFRRMLEYFGQAPIIVRSSSILEDGFGNAFAGKYESVFCANQGSGEERLKKLEEQLAGQNFARCNNCCLVNLRYVRSMEGSDVLVGEDRLLISRTRRKAFLQQMSEYFGGQ